MNFATSHQLTPKVEARRPVWLRFDDESGGTLFRLPQGLVDTVIVMPTAAV